MRFAALFFLTLAILRGQPPEAYLEGLRLAGGNRLPEALRVLETSIRQNPDFSPGYRRLAILADSANRESEANAFFEGLRLSPATAAYGHFGLAWIAFDKQKWQEAAALAEQTVRLAPDFLGGYLLWNRALGRVRNKQPADSLYASLLRQNPLHPIAAFAAPHLRLWSGERNAADLERLKTASEERPDSRDLAEAWLLSEINAGSPNRMFSAARHALSTAQRTSDPDLSIIASAAAAGALYSLGQVREAAALAEQTMDAASRLGDRKTAAETAYRGCVARMALDDGETARPLCSRAVDLATGSGLLAPIASDALSRMATMESRAGNLQSATAHMQQAITIASQTAFPIVPVNRRLDFADVLHSWGDYGQCESMARQAAVEANRLNNRDTELQALAVAGRCIASKGDFDGAGVLLEQALRIARDRKDVLREERVLVVYAEAALENGRIAQARPILEAAAKLASAHEDQSSLLPVIIAQGHAALMSADVRAAHGFFSQALRHAAASKREDSLWEATFGLGMVAERSADARAAIGYYQEAMAQSERTRDAVADPAWRATMFSTRSDVYRKATALYLAQGRFEEAFATIERFRARSLLELTGDTIHGADPELRRQEKLRAEAESALLSAVLGNASQGARTAARARADEADTGYRLRRSTMQQERGKGLSGSAPVDSTQLRKHLRPDEVFLAFTMGEQSGYLVTVTSSGLAAFPIPGRPALSRQIAQLGRLLQHPPQRMEAGPTVQLLTELYQTLLAKAEPVLRNKRHWIISPDGPLHQLPFGALLTGGQPGTDFSKAPFLIRRVSVLIAPSAGAWLRLASRKAPAPGPVLVAAFADSRPGQTQTMHMRGGLTVGPLPASLGEVSAIESIYGRNRTAVRTGDKVTRTQVLDLLSRSAIAHFAVHGYNDSSRPKASGLVLASAGREPISLLQAFEIQALRLQLRLAVLSACESSAGPELQGEGAQALSRAMLLAGAQSVVGSFWRVSDTATATLMTSFHRAFRNGLPGSRALREAQLQMIARSAGAHPYFWAAFQVAGADSVF